jgi:two-component system, sensor histidine kinase
LTARDIEPNSKDVARMPQSDSARAMSEHERLLSIAVHDLKNPLHSIVLFIAALKQSCDPERTAYLIDRLDRSTRGLDALFKRLLDMSRMDLGKLKATLSVFDLKGLFETLEGQFSAFAERKNLRFNVTLSDSVYVRADPVMTTEILINLLSNAFRYTQHGAISLRGHVEGTHFVIEVCDTGEGIQASRLNHIFEEFAQGGQDGQASQKGLGLGLAIVQRLARTMGTEVSVVSQVGRGSVFKFALQLSEDIPLDRPKVTPRKQLKGLLALVIDDDTNTLAAMEAILVASGSFVILARTLAEAAQKLESNERFPDIIISEANLKDGSGYVEIQARCAELIGQHLPFLIITKDVRSFESLALDQKATEIGGEEAIVGQGRARVAVIKKPAGSEEILNNLCQLIES